MGRLTPRSDTGGPHSQWARLLSRFFNKKLDFRVRLFNGLACVGVIVSLLSAIVAGVLGDTLREIVTYLAYCLLSVGLLVYATKTQQYQRCYIITIVAIFLIGFPLFFWMGGGYYGAMPYFFVFAVVFTVFMLEGKSAILISSLELTVYFAICVYAYSHFPVGDNLLDAKNLLIETVFGFLIVSVALGAAMFIHFSIYNKQQRELEAAREEAIHLSEVKNIFLANMSHEIRTPINVMLGMTEMILRDSREETVSEYARKIQNAGDMLLVLVSNILDVSKIESGTLEMTEDSYRTAILIRELYEIGAESAQKRGLAFSLQVDESLPSTLWGDISRLKQIIANFLNNAAKYTSTGSITLDFSRRACTADDEMLLCVSVSDTGIGIKEENLPILFDAFTRIELPSHQSVEGTGLGLAIAKDLAMRMNGRIGVKSEYGAGSNFWVEIPQKIMDEKPIEDWQNAEETVRDTPVQTFTAPEAMILVVDDNLENLQTVRALLRRTLAHVDLAESGEECLDAVRKTDYHVILMDYMMPDMDGIQTLKRIRKERPDFHAPIIALTANAVSGTEAALLGEGFAAYISKPVSTQRLEEALAAHLPAELVNKRTVYPKEWASPALIEAMSRDLEAAGVSLRDGLRNAGGDLSLMARMAEIFVQSYPFSSAEITAAAAEAKAKPDRLRHLAHSLKGSAGYVGAAGLSFVAGRIEKACKDNSADVIELCLPLLFLEWKRTQSGLAVFAAHTRAVEPRAQAKADEFSFDPGRLAEYINRRVRRNAILEIDLLIAEKGGSCPPMLAEAKQALKELNFDKARQLLDESGLWEGSDHGRKKLDTAH